MSEQPYAYPFDPTGTATSNRIINERHTINPPDYTDFYFVVPLAGPFFKENLVVRHWPSGRELIEGVDFVLGYQFLSASRATAKPVYGAISIYDRELTGVLEVTYNTLGGQWTINEVTAAEMLSNATNNPRITTWEQVVEQPATFPVIDHEWDLVDLVGASEVVDALAAIQQAIADGGSGTNVVTQHINDENNPHNVTKAQVGLSLLQNYPVASINEGNEGLLNTRYMTPIRVKDAIGSQVGDAFSAHAGDFENPHQVTKVQVGLGQVQNYPIADLATARAGTSGVHYMTPEGVAAFLEEEVGTGVAEHINRQDNPHMVTQAQVGLGSVPNFPMATVAIAEAGNAPDYFMSPYHTKLLVNELVSTPLANHISDFENPHSVTKTQVGLGSVQNYAIASEAEAKAATALDKYMTPYAVRLTINELVGGSIGEHPNDLNNPHQVTKAQVGLSSVENYPMATAPIMDTGTSTAHYLSPKVVADYIAAGVASDLSSHENRIDNPHQVTKAQVGLGNVDNYATAGEPDARAGTRSDLFVTPQGAKWAIDAFISGNYGNLSNRLNTLETTQTSVSQDLTDHVANLANPHNVTLDQLNAFSRGEVENLLLQKLDVNGVAQDSVRLDGLTRDEIVASIETEASDTYVTNVEITQLTNNLTTSFEDGMWELNGGNVIRLQVGSLSSVFTQTTDRILDFDGTSTSRWLAVGTGGLAAFSTDNGLNWTAIATGVTEDIAYVRFVTEATWVMATVSGVIYQSNDAGINWTQVATLGEVITSLMINAPSDVYAIGTTKMLRSQDGGTTFLAADDLSAAPLINDAAITAAGEVYLATNGGLYLWTSPGPATSVTGISSSVQLDHVETDTDGHIVAVETGGIHHRYSAINTAWQQIDHTRQLKELIVDGYNLWAAITLDDRVIRSINGGRDWAEVPTTPTTVALWSIGTGDTGWLVGGAGGDLFLAID